VYKRKTTKTIAERLHEPRRFMQIVVGPRQTGKTTAVTQAIEDSGIPCHFASADDPFAQVGAEWLRNEWEQARILAKGSSGGAILAIDEIQKAKDWDAAVKALWDEDARKRTALKVVITGSSSLLLKKGMSDSLMGRFETIRSPQWSFAEMKDAFGYSLDDFLYFGGYPGAAALKDDETRWARYMGDAIVEPAITKDILSLKEIRKPALLRALFILGASFSAQELSYTKMLGRLHDAGNVVTLAEYLDLLDKANVICGLKKYSKGIIGEMKSSPRLMAYDTSLMVYASGTGRRRLLEDSTARGHLVETAVGAALLARSKEEGFEVYWWRERGDEVDFVLKKGAAVTAIEVKSGRVKNTSGSAQFLKDNQEALLLTVGGSSLGSEDFLLGHIPLFKS
jgi:predicted AAA+ superfamily ATPase